MYEIYKHTTRRAYFAKYIYKNIYQLHICKFIKINISCISIIKTRVC